MRMQCAEFKFMLPLHNPNKRPAFAYGTTPDVVTPLESLASFFIVNIVIGIG